MAKDRTLPIVAGLAALGGLLFFATKAKADDTGPSWDTPARGGGRGKGPGGSPKAKPGGNVFGPPAPGASYLVPEDWDPVRGVWISPDCAMAVEAPGFYCGSDGNGLDEEPNVYGGFLCNAEERETFFETMMIPGNGAAGYVAYLINVGLQPEEIAARILEELSPLCFDVNPADWGAGLQAWYDSLLERVIVQWEEEGGGIGFEEEAEA